MTHADAAIPMADDSRATHRFGGIIIVALTIAAYLPAIWNAGYIWDDDQYLTSNPLLQHGVEGLMRLWQPRQTPQYYPVVFTTFWIENQLWGLQPRGFHIVNVLLHALNALLVWRLAARLSIPWAWLIGAIFALHPVHVESVAWITERKNTLSGLFYLLAALAYLRFDAARSPHVGSGSGVRGEGGHGRPWATYALSLVLFVLALLSKSVTCSLPAALILMMLWQRKPLTLARLSPLLPFFVIGLALALNTAQVERDHVKAIGPDFAFSIGDRLLIASRALLFYPWTILVPWPLMFIYPRWAIDSAQISQYWSVAACGAIALGLIIAYARGWRGVPLAIAFFAGTIFPALGFINVYPMLFSFVADHFQYLASLGVIATVIGSIGWCAGTRGPPAAIALVVLLPLGVLTFMQARMYAGPLTLWSATIERNPAAWIAHANIVPVLLSQAEEAQTAKRMDEALALRAQALLHAEAAFAGKPDHPPVLSNLSEARRLAGDVPGALAAARLAIERVPDDANYRWQLGRLLESDDRWFEAVEAYRAAVERGRDSIMYRASLAHVLLERLDDAGARLELEHIVRLGAADRGNVGPADVIFLQRLVDDFLARGMIDEANEAAALAERLARALQPR